MRITSFNPLIITKDSESTIKLFEELGFERRHTKKGIGIDNITDVRMEDANGFNVDITQDAFELTVIRMNVDNLEEAIALLEAQGFHKSRKAAVHETVDTGSSRFNIMVSSSGFIFDVSQHMKDHD